MRTDTLKGKWKGEEMRDIKGYRQKEDREMLNYSKISWDIFAGALF